MKRELIQNVKVTPYTSEDAIDRDGFLSAALVNFDLDLVGCKQFIKIKVEVVCTGGSSASCTATAALVLGDKAYTPA